MLSTETKNTYHRSVYFDEPTHNAMARFSETFFEVNKTQITHAALKWFCAWELTEANNLLPDHWQITGNRPKNIQLSQEPANGQKNGLCLSVHIKADLYVIAEQVAKLKGLSARQVIRLAVETFLIDQGFLTEYKAI